MGGLHDAFAQVLDASGAGQKINELLRYLEVVDELAANGSLCGFFVPAILHTSRRIF